MFKAILEKEFSKIKYIYLVLICIFLSSLFYLYFNLRQNFSNIEPHSMLWYEAVHIGNLYYEDLKFLPYIAAIIIALSQFLPEIHKNKFRLVLHLPINQNKMLFLYLGVGFLLLLILNIILVLGLYFISLSLYPKLIALSAIKTSLPWIIASFIIYNGCVSIMIEPYFKRKAFLTFIFFSISSILFLSMEYEAYNNSYLFLFFLLISSFFIPLLSLYRFKNGTYSLWEEKRLLPKITFIILAIFTYISLSFYLPYYFKEFSKDSTLATYIFYSAKEKKFVYKQHLGNHNFKYKDSLDNILSKKEYEKALPFVFWKNLDIQGRLPIIINSNAYSKAQIKKSRQSFKFTYKNLSENKNQILLYPLFNANSKKGVISFPSLMFTLDKGFRVYESEDNSINKKLSLEYTKILEDKKFSFPAKIIAGKTTNLKPLDEGYFILDKKNNLFHIKKYDDKLYVKNIFYNKKIKIKDIKISESKKREFYGVILDEKNRLYMLSYKNYELIPIKLKYYNALTMELEIYADVLNKIIRYKDKNIVYASVYDTDFKLIDIFKAEIPQINSIYETIFSYIFPFYIKRNEYKIYEDYIFKIGSYKAFLLNFLFCLIYIIFCKSRFTKRTLFKTFLILFGGIYTIIFINLI